jgi:drug/metabolite transporter (DMT)-like permease
VSMASGGIGQPADALGAGRRTVYRTYSLLAAFVVLRAFGNLSLAWGTKHFPEVLALNPLSYLRAMLSPPVTMGVGMLILAMLVRMAVLGVADLSFVLPLTAIGYVFAALLGRFILHEDVTPQRWLGTVLIFIGVALVGSTPQNTTPQNPTKERDQLK